MRRLLKPIYETAVFLGSGALECRLPGGEVVRVGSRWRNLTWNPEEYAAFRAATRPGDVVIEAGANAGGYAVLFGQWVGRQGRVYAFEPDPRAFAALQHHVTLNAMNDRVIPVHAAVASKSGTTRLRLAPASGLSRLAHGDDAREGDTIAVPAVSIDDFCSTARIHPSVIKIDVEGAEMAALQGARRTIQAAGASLHLFVEMHPAMWRDLGIDANEILRECDASSLTLERLDGGREGLWELEGVCLRLRPAAARV